MTIHRFRSDPLFFLSVIGSVILLAGLAWPFFFGEIYASKDLGRFHIPVRWFYAQALENGDDWLWFPYGFGGYYVHGEGQGTLAHPLNWLGYRWLGFHSAFAIEFMRSWIFLVVGMFFLFRRLELARGAAAFGALLFSFCSFGFLHFGHLNFTGIVSHIPWVLIAADVALRSQRPRSIALARAALALLIASQLLHAHPQVAWMSLVLLAAFSAARLLERRKQIDSTGSWAIAKAVGGLALAVALGFVMAGIQLLPMLDGLEHSFRAAPGSGFLGMFALSPYESFQLFSPYLFHGRSHGLHLPERGFYAGAAVPPLIVWAAMRRKSLGPAARWWGWGMALAVIGFLLALGEKGLLHRLQQELPLVGLFRAPARFVLVAHLGLAVAAAVGFADLAKERTPVHRPPLRALWPLASVPLASLLVTGLALGVLHPVGNSTRVTSGLPGIAIGPVMALVASGLVAAAVHRPRLALSLLVLLTAADLGAYGLSHVHSYPPVELERWAELDVPPGIDPASRKELGPQKETMRGVRLAVGYAAMTPSRLLSFESRPFTPRARSVAVEGAHRQNALRVAAITESRDGPVEGALPRVRLVASTVATKSVPLMLSQIDPAEVALIEEDLMLPPGPRGDARLLEDRPGRIRIETNAPAERLLIVSERFHEGWRATSEGGGCRLIRVYGDFMGCVVPAGRSELELRFEPDSPVRGPIREMSHVAYEVRSIKEASKGLKELLAPFEAGIAVVGFYQTDDGAVVEFMEMKEKQ